jgi:hypothetical protein
VRHGRTSVGCGGERQETQPPVASEDRVGTELVDVLGGRAETSSAAEQTRIHAQRAEGPDLAVAAAFGAEQAVQAAVDIGDDRERNREVVTVGSESFGCGEGDNSDGGVTELVEVIAHGDHVFLAWQSSKVSVQYQHEGVSTLFGGVPGPASVIDEFEVWESVADAVGHVRVLSASSTSRWTVGYASIIVRSPAPSVMIMTT